MLDVMLDLETMGNGPRAAIVAIGAVVIDLDTGVVGARFYRTVRLDSSLRHGGDIDAGTVLWWLQRDDDARAAITSGGIDLSQALLDFSDWLSESAEPEAVRLWGNGAGFDNVILASAYRAAALPLPWRYWNDRCYRTIKALHPDVKLERVGVYHNAVDDAHSQALHLIAMMTPQPAAKRPEVFIVGQVRGSTWEFQGVFSTEAAADSACKTTAYWMAPATLDATVADERLPEWPGLRWPRCDAEPAELLWQTQAAREVLEERQRQIDVEGWTPEHDDEHDGGQMATAAACYAAFTLAFPAGDPCKFWPWAPEWWKPADDKRRNLVKAGALILAEIERLDRAEARAANVS